MTTGRVGQISIDGTPISAADVARMEAEEALHAEWARKAVRVVAASSVDAEDCRTLLAILGLDGGHIVRDARGPHGKRGSRGKHASSRSTTPRRTAGRSTSRTATAKTSTTRKPRRRTAA
jgi:hypothetical protein